MMYVFSVGQFAGDRGKKEASKEVGEEKGKRKRLTLRERKKRNANTTKKF
jgi:translation initiation factor IF-2